MNFYLYVFELIFYENIFNFVVVVLNTIIEGTMSQNFFLGPRSNFIQFRKLSSQKLQNVSRFWP